MEDSASGFTFFEFKVDDMETAKEILEKEVYKITQVYTEKALCLQILTG